MLHTTEEEYSLQVIHTFTSTMQKKRVVEASKTKKEERVIAYYFVSKL